MGAINLSQEEKFFSNNTQFFAEFCFFDPDSSPVLGAANSMSSLKLPIELALPSLFTL